MGNFVQAPATSSSASMGTFQRLLFGTPGSWLAGKWTIEIKAWMIFHCYSLITRLYRDQIQCIPNLNWEIVGNYHDLPASTAYKVTRLLQVVIDKAHRSSTVELPVAAIMYEDTLVYPSVREHRCGNTIFLSLSLSLSPPPSPRLQREAKGQRQTCPLTFATWF